MDNNLINNHKSPIPKGLYHCIIMDVTSGTTRKSGIPYDRLTLEVLTGEHPGQQNKKFSQLLFYQKVGDRQVETNAHVRWAWAAGILHPGETIDFNPGMLRGKQVIVRVVPQKNTDYNEVDDRGYAVWLIGNEDVANVPTLTLPKPFESDN